MNDELFKEQVWQYYTQNGRDLPWRNADQSGVFDPYKIIVSEIMLQQTQANRVISKYTLFMQQFPDVRRLASASFAEVLSLWSGLGYNRRAKYLHQLAIEVVQKYDGVVPQTREALVTLPGIGINTAGAVLAYAYNQPAVFIETNIRTVYIHHFFSAQEKVSDAQLLPIVERTLDTENARKWYWALMDYGTYLKSTVGNVSKSSVHYRKQSKFDGSVRQIRGQVIKQLTSAPATEAELTTAISDPRLTTVLKALLAEGMITQRGSRYQL